MKVGDVSSGEVRHQSELVCWVWEGVGEGRSRGVESSWPFPNRDGNGSKRNPKSQERRVSPVVLFFFFFSFFLLVRERQADYQSEINRMSDG